MPAIARAKRNRWRRRDSRESARSRRHRAEPGGEILRERSSNLRASTFARREFVDRACPEKTMQRLRPADGCLGKNRSRDSAQCGGRLKPAHAEARRENHLASPDNLRGGGRPKTKTGCGTP